MKKTFYLPFSTIETNTHRIYTEFLEKRGDSIANIPKKVDLKNINLAEGYIIPPTIIVESTFKSRLLEFAPHLYTSKVKKAIKLAKQVHGEQKRRSGVNYLEGHLFPIALYYIVTEQLYRRSAQEDILVTCLLHDILEDGINIIVNKEQLIDRSINIENSLVLEEVFGKEIADMVYALTKKSKNFYSNGIYRGTTVKQMEHLRNTEYVQNLKKASKQVQLVKCIDRILNLSNDIEFHENRDKQKIKEYLKETKKYYSPLYTNTFKQYKVIFKVTTDIISSSF